MFLPCGTMFHTVLTLQATWRLGGRQIRSERRRSSRRRRSRGPESTRSSSKHVRKKSLSKGWSNDLPHATWHPEKRPIVIKSKALIWSEDLPDRHRTVPVIRIGRQRSFLEERCDRGAIEPRSHHDRIAIERRLHSFGAKSGDQIVTLHQAVIGGTSTVRSTPDRDAIVARSARDRGWFATKLRPQSSSIDQTAPTTDRGHQSVSTIASIGHHIRANFPL